MNAVKTLSAFLLMCPFFALADGSEKTPTTEPAVPNMAAPLIDIDLDSHGLQHSDPELNPELIDSETFKKEKDVNVSN